LKTLAELASEMERLSDREAVVYHDGLRTRKWSYRDLRRAVAGIAERMDSMGLAPGDRILLWGENRPEWVAVFWAAVLKRITLVPLDFRSSSAFVSRVQQNVGAKLLVHGSSVVPEGVELSRLACWELGTLSEVRSDSSISADAVDPEDVVQILYTSGTTGEPKGVVHRHRHLAPNLASVHQEIQKYRWLARPFQPIRFLDLLPLSHVFGQLAGLFVPLLMGGSVVFLKEFHPRAILETIRRERVSVLVSVPRFLESLRREIERRFDLRRPEVRSMEARGLWGGVRRFLRHRDVHGAFGFKFWAILSGGARLPPQEEEFWDRLGFVVVQGYGLTEATSLVTTNHPLHPTRGSVGKIVGSQEIRLAPDGEILVKGTNVSLELFGQEQKPSEDVWLHTGDLGELGPDGTLFYRGRKKDVIIGPEGLNVYPVDVEAALARDPAVKEAVVLGRASERGEVVHAVLLLRNGDVDPSAIVERANRGLESHQRIREWTVWPHEDFPRTASTFKVRRQEVAKAIGPRATPAAAGSVAEGVSAVRALIAEQLGRRPEEVRASQALAAELGLSSLDRIELLSTLEDRYGVELSDAEIAEATTVEDLERWVRRETGDAPAAAAQPREREPPSPLSGIVRFARLLPVRILRAAFLDSLALPLFRRYIPLAVEGSVEDVTGPVIFAPNHSSNLDTVAVLAAMPRRIRHRLAPAVSQDYFLPYLAGTGTRRERISLAVQFWLAVLTVNVFPLPQATRGVRDALQFAGKLVDRGYSILIYPEGARTPDGRMKAFRPGVGILAVRLGIPVVPVHIQGLFEVLPVNSSWPTPGPVRLRFGAPIRFREGEDFRAAARKVEEEVRRLEAQP
jgi:long-chain acyl-CoA synthetase